MSLRRQGLFGNGKTLIAFNDEIDLISVVILVLVLRMLKAAAGTLAWPPSPASLADWFSFAVNLSDDLEHVEIISEVSTTGLEPAYFPFRKRAPLR